jgi:hypothetical protein
LVTNWSSATALRFCKRRPTFDRHDRRKVGT